MLLPFGKGQALFYSLAMSSFCILYKFRGVGVTVGVCLGKGVGDDGGRVGTGVLDGGRVGNGVGVG